VKSHDFDMVSKTTAVFPSP